MRDLIIKTGSSTTLYNWFKKNKKIYTTPEPGDVVFFNFDKKPKPGECTHVGIVTRVISSKQFKTVEGNTSFEKAADGTPAKEANGGAVAERTRTIDKTVRGFGRPAYSDNNTKTTPQPATKLLKIGSSGPEVQNLHDALWRRGYGVDRNSDTFTDLTARCVKHFQASNGLEIDEIVGPATAAKLYN